jgi:hypothetical protein
MGKGHLSLLSLMSKRKDFGGKLGQEVNLRTPMKTEIPRPKCLEQPKAAPPFPFGLRYIAHFFPFGMETMMQFASYSQSRKVRNVAWAWRVLDKAAQQTVEPEMLCEKEGVSSEDFLASVMGVAHELGADVAPVFEAMIRMPYALEAALQKAACTGEGLEQAMALIE